MKLTTLEERNALIREHWQLEEELMETFDCDNHYVSVIERLIEVEEEIKEINKQQSDKPKHWEEGYYDHDS